jgi:hypothetical protein
MRGRQVVWSRKELGFYFFIPLKWNKKKEISKKKMKNIVETELKLCVLSRMKIYFSERKA